MQTKTDCKHNNSERFNSTDIIIIVIIIIIIVIIVIIIQAARNLPLMRHCAEVAADAKAPGANFSGVVADPLREQAGMDALVLPSPVKQKAMKQVSCT